MLKTLKRETKIGVITFPKAPDFGDQTAVFSLLTLLSLTFIYQFSVTSFETVFSIYAKNDLSFTAYQIGIGFMLCGLFIAVFQPVFASVKTKLISEKDKLLAGFVITNLALLIMPFIKGYIFVYILIILFAIGGALIAPQISALISMNDENNTAKNLSVQTSVNYVGQIIGPLIGTWLAGKQVSSLFMVSSGLLVIPVFFILWNKRR